MKELIHIHITTGNYIQAIPFIEKGIENIISLYGENSFIIINWLIDLATCYKYGVGNDSQLLLLCEKVLNLAKIHYKKESLIYAQTIHNICTILDEIIPSEILLAIEEEVFSIRKKLLPHNHPQYLSSLNSIITYYTKCNMLKEAISIGEQMLNTNKKNMDGALLHNLAIAYSKTGNVPKAIHLLEKTSEIYKKEFGKCNIHYLNLKSATKLFSVLLASKRPLITELADKLRLKYPLLPTISPCPTMRLEAIRSIIPISCRRYPKSV